MRGARMRIEVHSVREVVLQDRTGERQGGAAALLARSRPTGRFGNFFHATTRRSSFGPGGGDDVFLSIADLDGRAARRRRDGGEHAACW